MSKLIYSFGAGIKEGNRNLSDLLGGKGANLAEMGCLGVPIDLAADLDLSARQHPSEHHESCHHQQLCLLHVSDQWAHSQ